MKLWPFNRTDKIVDRLIEKLEEKASETGPVIASISGRSPIWTPRNYKSFAEEGYQKNIVVYRSIDLIATSLASIPWVIRKSGKEVDEHPLVSLLARPNPLMATSEFFYNVTGYYLISGNSYIEAAATESGENKGIPRELYPLRPDRMLITPGENSLPAKYTYEVGSSKVVWDVDQLSGQSLILHIKKFHPLNDWYGLSPIEAAAISVDLRNDTDAWNKNLVQNDARPPGALVHSPKDGMSDLTPETIAILKEDLNEHYTGVKNAGRPLLLTGGLDWKQMSINPKDMDWINAKHTTATDIAQALGVPPQLIGIPGSQTFANFEQARLAMWEDTVIPTITNFKDELNGWLAPMFGDDISIDYNLDDIPALVERRKQHFEMIDKVSYLSINEKREMSGFDPIDGGDAVLVPATMVPLGEEINIDIDDEIEEGGNSNVKKKIIKLF